MGSPEGADYFPDGAETTYGRDDRGRRERTALRTVPAVRARPAASERQRCAWKPYPRPDWVSVRLVLRLRARRGRAVRDSQQRRQR